MVAIVDNDVVMHSQLDQRLREVEQTIAKRGGQMPLQDDAAAGAGAPDRREPELQIGDRSGIPSPGRGTEPGRGTIAQRNNLTLEKFRAALSRDGLSYEEARDQVRREMIISRVRQRRVAERIQVTDQVQNFRLPTSVRCSCRKITGWPTS